MRDEHKTLYWALKNSRDRIIGAAYELGGDLEPELRKRVDGLLKDLDETSRNIYMIEDDA